MAQLGFIVCVMDARGTPGRGKQFHDVIYKNMGRHEIADHAAALKQLAEERPYMDLERVGIYGYSFGGYLAIRALLQAPEVYDVGIATEPFPETLPLFWSYLGWPEEEPEVYNYLSNRNLASDLKGRLFLIHGDPAQEAVMKMVRALIQENKFFDLLAIPGADHAFTGTDYEYWQEAVRRYFVEHLKP